MAKRFMLNLTMSEYGGGQLKQIENMQLRVTQDWVVSSRASGVTTMCWKALRNGLQGKVGKGIVI